MRVASSEMCSVIRISRNHGASRGGNRPARMAASTRTPITSSATEPSADLVCNDPGPPRRRRRHHFAQRVRIEFEPDREQRERQRRRQQTVLPHLGRRQHPRQQQRQQKAARQRQSAQDEGRDRAGNRGPLQEVKQTSSHRAVPSLTGRRHRESRAQQDTRQRFCEISEISANTHSTNAPTARRPRTPPDSRDRICASRNSRPRR